MVLLLKELTAKRLFSHWLYPPKCGVYSVPAAMRQVSAWCLLERFFFYSLSNEISRINPRGKTVVLISFSLVEWIETNFSFQSSSASAHVHAMQEIHDSVLNLWLLCPRRHLRARWSRGRTSGRLTATAPAGPALTPSSPWSTWPRRSVLRSSSWASWPTASSAGEKETSKWYFVLFLPLICHKAWMYV